MRGFWRWSSPPPPPPPPLPTLSLLLFFFQRLLFFYIFLLFVFFFFSFFFLSFFLLFSFPFLFFFFSFLFHYFAPSLLLVFPSCTIILQFLLWAGLVEQAGTSVIRGFNNCVRVGTGLEGCRCGMMSLKTGTPYQRVLVAAQDGSTTFGQAHACSVSSQEYRWL